MHRIAHYDWLTPYWRRLSVYIAQARVPQALLIAGAAGLGKRRLAETFAQRLLCRAEGEYACGACPSCHLFLAGTHPDFICVGPEEAGKIIPVDAIRKLIATLALKPQYQARRVVIIDPAHQMNAASANSLLKTLEEPDADTSLLLLSDAPHTMPATILSRCQRMDIALPDPAAARAWLARQGHSEAAALLALARGAPLAALALAETGSLEKRREFHADWRSLRGGGEPVRLADKWSKFPAETLLDWMESWTTDLIRLSSAPGCKHLGNADLAAGLQALAPRLQLRPLFGFLDLLRRSRRALSGQANRQLVLEEVLIHWLRLAGK
jgi:DNA polymerase-3 subunit delta'